LASLFLGDEATVLSHFEETQNAGLSFRDEVETLWVKTVAPPWQIQARD